MQALGGTAVAAAFLIAADHLLNAGRYSEVAGELVRQACGLVGIHF